MFRVKQVSPCCRELPVTLPRNRYVSELRKLIENSWGIPPAEQRLFYLGKQLVDSHMLIEYGIQRDHVVTLAVQKYVAPLKEDIAPKSPENDEEEENLIPMSSLYFDVGDLVDFRMGSDDGIPGAWFEATIVAVVRKPDDPEVEESVIFLCQVEKYDYMQPFKAQGDQVRPRSFHIYKLDDLKVDLTVMANVNFDKPKEIGHWYDVKLTHIRKNFKGIAMVCDAEVECEIMGNKKLMRIEKKVLKSERGVSSTIKPPIREYAVDCQKCKDVKTRKCKHCGCNICGNKDKPEMLLLCDECDMGFHIHCLSPPLKSIPQSDEDWYCPGCKNTDEVVKAGERLKTIAKRVSKGAARKDGRDWDRGMSCAGRRTVCEIVPINHIGHVPGVAVGTIWQYRSQISEAGIHRPLVAGIHGRSNDAAYSIVFSGGYEDDVDNGEEFDYTGAGGRNLSGNKRQDKQGFDQVLEHTNLALAKSCNVKVNAEVGAKSKAWKEGKPVRVVRKAGSSKFAPKEGYRYDGIYKVVKYWPDKGKSGFVVWKFLMRRDDPNPPPWSKSAPIFEMIRRDDTNVVPSSSIEKDDEAEDGILKPLAKRKKLEFKLSEKIDALIIKDTKNSLYWKDCCAKIHEGETNFLNLVAELFRCPCCFEIVNQPITLPCQHNVCDVCLGRCFKAGLSSCPNCRLDLDSNFAKDVNKILLEILNQLFPGTQKA